MIARACPKGSNCNQASAHKPRCGGGRKLHDGCADAHFGRFWSFWRAGIAGMTCAADRSDSRELMWVRAGRQLLIGPDAPASELGARKLHRCGRGGDFCFLAQLPCRSSHCDLIQVVGVACGAVLSEGRALVQSAGGTGFQSTPTGNFLSFHSGSTFYL